VADILEDASVAEKAAAVAELAVEPPVSEPESSFVAGGV
jgi:hypothetical protein